MTSLIHKRHRSVVPPAPRTQQIIHNHVRQTVVHLHQVTHQHVLNRISSTQFLRTDAFLLVMPRIVAPGRDTGLDQSRPTQSAQRLIRIFSKESAQRELRPFYSDVVRSVLKEEQERYKSRPSQAISLIWNLFGRQHAFRTLTRFYMGAVEKLGTNYYPALTGSNALYLAAGVVLHSRVYQRYVRQLWSNERAMVPSRYVPQEHTVAEDLMRLPVVRRTLPPRETVEKIADSEQQADVRQPTTDPTPELRLSDADFRALVQGVANSLGRQTRLESLRRGGL